MAGDFPDDPLDDLYAGPSAAKPGVSNSAAFARAKIARPNQARVPSRKALRTAAAMLRPERTRMSDAKPTITLVEWRALEKNTLRGFADIRFPFGLVIKGISIHKKNGQSWVAMPSKPQIEQDGSVRREPDGKIKYVSILEWAERAMSERFSASVIALVEDQHGQLP